ncbi:hypothetical protein [Candidatus Profftia tarda]|uniref:hypothetical protein n=1 Tax=Candidatus Profftia tarda TaxID=1177216 RepID=UPI003B968DB7
MIHFSKNGAMTGYATLNDIIWYSTSNNPRRKYAHSWNLSQTQLGHLVCINTMQANTLV